MLTSSIEILRPKEWIKNSFVLAPLIFADKLGSVDALSSSLFAFLIFCLASSAVYILNDLIDFESDSLHPAKRDFKPLPSGRCKVRTAKFLLGLHYVLLVFAYLFESQITQVALAYLVLNVLYSLSLKNIVFVDILTIAIGFVLRVLAGAIALNVPLSFWTFIITLFISTFLASIKRHHELKNYGVNYRKVLSKYSLSMLNYLIISSGTLTVAFYLIFVLKERFLMVLTVPFVFTGVGRYFILFRKNILCYTPIETVVSDPILLGSIIFWALSGACVMLMF